MSKGKKLDEEQHKIAAVNAFNNAWDYIEKEDRTPEDDETMVHLSHTSRYHWGLIGNELNFTRGEWQLARIYTILGRKEEALRYAKICLDRTLKNKYEGFDLAFGYEVMARACALNGQKNEFEKYYNLAKKAGDKIDKEKDRTYFYEDLEKWGWFGLK